LSTAIFVIFLAWRTSRTRRDGRGCCAVVHPYKPGRCAPTVTGQLHVEGTGAGTRFLISKFLITKFLITKFLITKFLSNKVPKLQNS
jgi:hypothetical protein